MLQRNLSGYDTDIRNWSEGISPLISRFNSMHVHGLYVTALINVQFGKYSYYMFKYFRAEQLLAYLLLTVVILSKHFCHKHVIQSAFIDQKKTKTFILKICIPLIFRKMLSWKNWEDNWEIILITHWYIRWILQSIYKCIIICICLVP